MKIIGISAWYHDSAAALVDDGSIIAAAQEERFTRKKHDAAFPAHALAFCLDYAGCTLDDVDFVVFYDKPFLKFERIVETYLAMVPHGFESFRRSMPLWLKEKLFQKRLLAEELGKFDGRFDAARQLLFTEHHQSHAASAFYASPFTEAAILTMDGVGEWATTSAGTGRDNHIVIEKEIHFPHSLGLLYSAFTYFAGFRVNSGEYKLMGLAPFGEPVYADCIRDHLIDIRDDGSFHLDMDYFNYCTGLTMTNDRFNDLFDGPPRQPETPITQREMDLAASVQQVTEDVVLKLARDLRQTTACGNLCLAGGVALNCVANGKLVREGIFDRVWIQPAAGDAGGAVGAALTAYHHFLGQPRTYGADDNMNGSLLGPDYAQSDIEQRLSALGAEYEVTDDDQLIQFTASALAEGQATGWFQGRMEFGPRALGNRSILADPRQGEMQKKLNLKIKFRESFRPFAPSILREHVADWFDLDVDSPYMLLVADVSQPHRRKPDANDKHATGLAALDIVRSDIPAVTHVDYSARVQTVDACINPRYHRLISAFHDITGVPMLVNTSFNIRGEPIVCTPEDAYRCFMGTDLDLLVIGNCILRKGEQKPGLLRDYRGVMPSD
jgi:carbamoyltransferase